LNSFILRTFVPSLFFDWRVANAGLSSWLDVECLRAAQVQEVSQQRAQIRDVSEYFSFSGVQFAGCAEVQRRARESWSDAAWQQWQRGSNHQDRLATESKFRTHEKAAMLWHRGQPEGEFLGMESLGQSMRVPVATSNSPERSGVSTPGVGCTMLWSRRPAPATCVNRAILTPHSCASIKPSVPETTHPSWCPECLLWQQFHLQVFFSCAAQFLVVLGACLQRWKSVAPTFITRKHRTR